MAVSVVRRGSIFLLGAIIVLLSLSRCTASQLIPGDLEFQISRDLSYNEIKRDAGKYRGRLVALGGYVLTARRLEEEIRLEVLQLPLKSSDRPIRDLMKSEGRFLAFSKKFRDPATMAAGSYVSIVAEVLGSESALLDNVTYTYPTFAIKTFKVWPKSQQYARPFPFWDRWNYPFDDPWTYPYWGAH
jgi:outer membrane lipoprotein